MNHNILSVNNIKMHFPIKEGLFKTQKKVIHAVDGISFSVKRGETLGIVGESGCGKTTLGRTILGLYKPTSGSVNFENHKISEMNNKKMVPLRKNIQMIFQDPFESLNSRHTVRYILEEPFIIHKIGNRMERAKKIRGLLEKVGLPTTSLDRYPHEFSGGQRQRIGIARAIALQPAMIVCDEPVSALDVSIQSQILNLLMDLQKEMGLTYIFISHNLTVVRHVSDRIAVMYLGRIVEFSDAETIIRKPLHPYTQALISAIPELDPLKENNRIILQGSVPSPISPPSGCHFRTRCSIATDICKDIYPNLNENNNDHFVACHFPGRRPII